MNLKQLLGICEHKWVQIDMIQVFADSIIKDMPKAFEYHLKCEKCGNIKKKRV